METVAVYFGALRSLTTISSAMMSLHPEVTVLNHAFERIFADAKTDFLRDPTPETLDRFVHAASEMALGGRQGDYGGHIVHSHAFQADQVLRQAYLDLYGWDAKPATKCILWKEATKVANHFAKNRLDARAITDKLPALRFIAMVRNPVDIVISSIRKGYSVQLVGPEKKDDFGAVFVQVLQRFAWFSRHAQERPDQFRFVYQDELLDRDHLIGLCDFLRISAPQSWLDDVARLIRLRESYAIPEERKAQLKEVTARVISDPTTARRVMEQIV